MDVAPFHLPRSFVGLQRVAGGPGIDAANVVDKPLEGLHVPNVKRLEGLHVPDFTLGVDLKEELRAVLADESLHQARREIAQLGRLGIGHALKDMEPAEQVAGQAVLVRGEAPITLA